jgi:hypothetical protein
MFFGLCFDAIQRNGTHNQYGHGGSQLSKQRASASGFFSAEGRFVAVIPWLVNTSQHADGHGSRSLPGSNGRAGRRRPAQVALRDYGVPHIEDVHSPGCSRDAALRGVGSASLPVFRAKETPLWRVFER